MQLLIDSTQETPASLRFIAGVLSQMAELYTPAETARPSINGPSAPVVLHSTTSVLGDASITETTVTGLDPAKVFGRADLYAGVIHHNIQGDVPTGTPEDFTQPGMTAAGTQTAVKASAPPAPTVSLPDASRATTIAGITAPAAPDAGNIQAPDTAAADTVSDKDGIPWDARIHSETRKTNADGAWRYRRNLDPNVKAVVTLELKAKYGTQAPLASIPAPPAPSAPPAPPAPVAPQPPAASLPVPNGLPVGVPNAPLPGVVSTSPATNFRELMSKVNKAKGAGLLSEQQLTLACRAVNIDSITALASQPDKVPLVDAQINQILGA